MKRRSILVLLGSVALRSNLPARAQQPGRELRLGLLLPYVQSDPQAQARVNSFTAALQERGWIDGRNVRLEFRYTEGESNIGRESSNLASSTGCPWLPSSESLPRRVPL